MRLQAERNVQYAAAAMWRAKRSAGRRSKLCIGLGGMSCKAWASGRTRGWASLYKAVLQGEAHLEGQ